MSNLRHETIDLNQIQMEFFQVEANRTAFFKRFDNKHHHTITMESEF